MATDPLVLTYHNREAFQLFQQHSTHLRKKREQEDAKRRTGSRGSKQKQRKGQDTLHVVTVSPRDPLLDYKRPRLVELLHETRTECDEAKRQLREAQTQAERQAHASRIELEQRYHKLLQEHMQCSVTIARLEAQHAEFQAFMERFRSALRKEEHDQGSSETN